MVNERDGLGDETPPDYLTSVREGGFYGWPYCYWGRTVDDRVPQDAARGRHARSHRTTRSADTPRRWACAGCRPARCPAFRDGMVIGQHGSWNRSTLSGYRVVFVPFADGRPSGPAARHPDAASSRRTRRESYGRPVGVAIGPDARRCWWPTTWAT